jgi:hypothetical protein
MCPAHLQRICGTCKHFKGALRASSPDLCTRFDVLKHPRRSAAECGDWTRPEATS